MEHSNRGPITEPRIRADLVALGVMPEMTLVVHSSLRSIGWVVGGAPALVRALLDTLGESGTLAMPAATPRCGDPVRWTEPRIPAEWIAEIRDHLPPFDCRTTPTTLGATPESFRTWPGTLRSNHPLESVCARGPHADEITREHPLAFSEGEGTPFAKLHELHSWVLLLGVGFNRCTALHHAESLVEGRRVMKVRFPMVEWGRRTWEEVPNVADDNDTHFPIVGERYVSAGRAKQGLVGAARATLFPMRDLVAFAREYFEAVL